MQLPAFPLRVYSQSQRKLFQKCIRRLRIDIEEIVEPGFDGLDIHSFIPDGEALRYFRFSRKAKAIVKKLWRLTLGGVGPMYSDSPLTQTVANSETDDSVASQSTADRSADAEEDGETFWKAIVGYDRRLEDGEDRDPSDARANILAILVRCKVTLLSRAWHIFFHLTKLSTDSNGVRFCDRILQTFKRQEDVRKVFGDETQADRDFSEKIFLEQYLVRALVFDSDEVNVAGEAQHMRLPYRQKDRLRPNDRDIHGETYRVRLHPAHFHGLNRDLFQKDIRRDIGREPREATILKLLSRNSFVCQNIVKVWAVVHFAEKISIFFEMANGDLSELLSGTLGKRPSRFQGRVRLFRELLSLAKGLQHIHGGIENSDGKFGIVHSDLRAKNILYFEYGKNVMFKIADFGISHHGYRGSGFAKSSQGPECECRPPEALRNIRKNDKGEPKMTSAYDVYAFGALVCMFLAWLWGGTDEYRKFNGMRDKTPFAESECPDNDWFFFIHPDRRDSGVDHEVEGSGCLHLELNTERGPVKVVIQQDQKIRRYFEDIREGRSRSDEEKKPEERKFIWDVYSILEKHCLHPDPEKRSNMETVHRELEELVLRSRH